jgi:ABC-type lipoprotein export system ATPase subunit
MSEEAPIIELKNVSKTYYRGDEKLDVLKNLDLTAPAGAFEA